MEYSSFTLSPRPLASTAANNVYNATFAKLGTAIRSSFHQKHGSDVIISIEQTNKQTTRQINRQINKQKLNYGIHGILTKFTEFTFKRTGSLFPQITRHVKRKAMLYLTISNI